MVIMDDKETGEMERHAVMCLLELWGNHDNFSSRRIRAIFKKIKLEGVNPATVVPMMKGYSRQEYFEFFYESIEMERFLYEIQIQKSWIYPVLHLRSYDLKAQIAVFGAGLMAKKLAKKLGLGE